MSISSSPFSDSPNLPRHVAIIMDGNGRWAKRHNLPRILGHKKGAEVAKKITIKARELGIPYLTLFAFSKENWQRPESEISSLLTLLMDYLNSEVNTMIEREIKFKVIGDIEDFPPELQDKIKEVEEKTAPFQKMILTLALSYSGRVEILRAIKEIAKNVKLNEIDPEDINESILRSFFLFSYASRSRFTYSHKW